MNWWLGDVPRRVFASGGLRFYGAPNAHARGLGERPERGTSDAGAGDPFSLDLRADERLRRLYLEAEQFDGYRRDQDVFGEGITIEDNMSVLVGYARGATLTYSLNAHSPWEGYRVSVNGTAGRAELDVVERAAIVIEADGGLVLDPGATPGSASDGVRRTAEQLVMQQHWKEAVEVPIPGDAGAHGGGDALLLHDLFVGPGTDALGRAAGYQDGLRAVAVGIAANESMATGRPVEIASLMDGVPGFAGPDAGAGAGAGPAR